MTTAIASLVADNLDLWTSATQRKSGAGRGGGKRISLYGIERLRALILDLAVRGKLVPQDAGDEPTQKLFRQICLSKDQSLPKARFNIPDAWRWVKLGQIATCKPGRTPSRKDSRFWGGDHSWVSIADLEDGGTLAQTAETISDLAANSLFRNDPSPAGSILMSFKLTIGKISRLGMPAYHNEAIVTVSPSIADLEPFLFLMLPNCARAGVSRNAIKGATLNSKSIFEISIPLPPLAEQRRIVAKVDELMAHCDALERESADAMAAHQALVEALLGLLVSSADAAELAANWARLEQHFDTLFTTEASIEALKQTILDLAVRGKLVEQDAADEAVRLPSFRQVSISSDWDEKVFQHGKVQVILPDGWKIAPLAQVSSHIVDCPHTTPKWTETGELCVRTNQIKSRLLDLSQPNYVSGETYVERIERLEPSEGDILYIREGGILGVGCRIPNGVKLCLGQRSMLVRCASVVSSYYLEILINSPFIVGLAAHWTTGGAAPRVNMSTVRGYPIPIPPLAEQHRIVAKVDALMAHCDALKARITDAATTQKHLADAITERAAA